MEELPKSFIVIHENFSPKLIEFSDENGWELYKWCGTLDQWNWDDSLDEETARDWFERGEVYVKKA
jgi:hypothetical protein